MARPGSSTSTSPSGRRAVTQASAPAITTAHWAAIRLFAMDVDGVLTDGGIYISADGVELKRFAVLDGLGLARLRQSGVAIAWISGRTSGATTHRATELKVPHLIQGCADKLTALSELAARLGLAAEQVCYMGDDIIDTAAITWAGIGVAPATAMPEVLAVADFIPSRAAGAGAVREVCDLIFTAQAGNISATALTK